jgi:N-acetylmuramoyl-L-alanine amidase
VNYIEKLLPTPSKARPGLKMGQVTTITIHWTGPYPGQTVEEPRDWWESSGLEASAHFIVKDDTVLAAIPIDEVAWHCGVPEGNKTSIGIEVIPANQSGLFSLASVTTLRELLATLPQVPLKRHWDWSFKDCPRWYTPEVLGGAERWAKLLEVLR